MSANIVRIPIKIRKSIQKDFCSCWDLKIFSAEGTPYLIMADGMSFQDIERFLDQSTESIGFYFSEPLSKSMDRIMHVLSRKIPVTINTKQVIPERLLEELAKVPHSAIHVSIDFLDGPVKNIVEPESSDIFALKEMVATAKSWKIFTVLSVQYFPHLLPRLDLYEMVDMVKNYISHMVVEFPLIKDEHYQENRQLWESLVPSSVDSFKHCYVASIPTRSWEVHPRHKKKLIKDLQGYLRFKKVGLEVVDLLRESNRIRHNLTGMSDLPLGMRPFFYAKTDGVFEETKQAPDQDCSLCQKPIFS